MTDTPQDWDRLSELLDSSLTMSDAERASWIEGLAITAPHLKGPLRVLLQHEQRLRTRITGPPSNAPSQARVELRVDATVGPYRLLRELGRGGMGEVWLAERRDGSLKRQVALKFPYVGGDRRQLAERLRREREILSSLEHPNVARLYDAAQTDDGQPYLVIEYVDGVSICEYCDRGTLPVRARIELFLRVLSAVQYAHTRLVVHRDLKPSNVLVTTNGEPFLLDFGIAKLLQDDAPGVTKEFGAAMTPDYAAPEQLLGMPVTTATDVYSLGLLLYQLLAGVHARSMNGNDPRSTIEWATEREPCKASEAVGDATAPMQKRDAIAAARATTPRALVKLLRGDLDNIAAKALAIEPVDRYTSVADFAADLRRHLRDEAVTAQAPTFRYRVGKFVRRHRVGVAGTAIALVALSVAATVALWQARVAAQQRNRAIAMADRNVAINSFLYTTVMDVTRTGAPISTQQMLERSEALAKQTFAQRPEHRAAILESLASAYRTLGDLKKALALLDEAAALTQGSNDTSLGAEIQCHRGWIVSRTDAPDVGRRIIDAALASPGIDLLTRSACTRYLAFIAQDMSDGASMLSHALEARALAQQSPSYSREVDASLVASIATAYELVGQIDKADAHYAAALTTLEDLGLDRSPNTLVIRSNRAIAITGTGNPRVALAQYDAILRVLKQDDPTGTPAPTFLANRAAVLEQLGRYEEALAQFQEALQVARDLNNDPWTAYSLVGLGEVSRKSGDIDAAKRYVQQLEQLGGGVASSGIAQTRLQRLRARLALSDGDHDRARNVARELIGDDTKRVSPESWLTAAEIELAAGDLDAAERYARSALEQSIARQSGMSHSNATGLSWLMLSHVKLRQNDADAARDALTNAVRHLENTVDGAHPALQDAAQLGERPADVKRKM